MGAVAASPFLGLIGERPTLHNPHLNSSIQRTTLEQLQRRARTGDLLVISKPGWGGWKTMQLPTGSEFYHAQPVTRQRGGRGTTLSMGEFSDPSFHGSTPEELRRQSSTIKQHMKGEGYRDAVLLRPNKTLSPSELKALENSMALRATQPYNKRRPVSAFLKDLFLPKSKAFAEMGKQVCPGDICATLPSQAHYEATGQNLVPGKKPSSVLATDLLRSPELKPIAAFMPEHAHMSPRTLNALKYGLRGGIGAALAATLYGVSEEPTAAAAPLGLLAAPAVGRTMIGGRAGRKALPELMQLLNVVGAKDKNAKAILSKIMRRTLPLGLGGAIATYLGAKGINSALSPEPTIFDQVMG